MRNRTLLSMLAGGTVGLAGLVGCGDNAGARTDRGVINDNSLPAAYRIDPDTAALEPSGGEGGATVRPATPSRGIDDRPTVGSNRAGTGAGSSTSTGSNTGAGGLRIGGR